MHQCCLQCWQFLFLLPFFFFFPHCSSSPVFPLFPESLFSANKVLYVTCGNPFVLDFFSWCSSHLVRGLVKIKKKASESLCAIGPTFCAVKKEVRRKRNTQTRRKGKKYSSRFYSAMITATRKVPSSPFLSVVMGCVWEMAVWHTPVTVDRS